MGRYRRLQGSPGPPGVCRAPPARVWRVPRGDARWNSLAQKLHQFLSPMPSARWYGDARDFIMLLWLMPMGVASSEAATLPADDLRIHLDASDTSKLFKTYDSGGKHSGMPADGGAVQVWDDEGDGIADIAFVYITDSARSPIYRSASSPMRHSCLDFDGIDDSLKAVTQDGLVEHPLSDFITASAFTLLIAFHPLSISDPDEFYNVTSLIGDGRAFWGIYLGNVRGQRKVTLYNWDRNADGVLLDINENQTYVLMYQHEGGNLFSSLNGGAELSVASGETTQLTSLLHIGKIRSRLVL